MILRLLILTNILPTALRLLLQRRDEGPYPIFTAFCVAQQRYPTLLRAPPKEAVVMTGSRALEQPQEAEVKGENPTEGGEVEKRESQENGRILSEAWNRGENMRVS